MLAGGLCTSDFVKRIRSHAHARIHAWTYAPRQGSAIDSSSNYVRCNLLKLLTIVAESGPSGFETVTNALDHVKVIFFLLSVTTTVNGIVFENTRKKKK